MPTTTLTNAGFETVPTFTAAQTADGWIDGTATGSATTNTSGWWASPRAAGIAVQFDTSKFRTGAASLKVSTTSTTGRARVFNCPASAGTVTGATSPYIITVSPSTSYTLTGWAQCTNAVAGAVFIELVELNSSFTVGVSSGSNTISGTVGTWTQLTLTVTTTATCAYLAVDMQNATAGNVADAWFDDLTLTTPTPGGGTSRNLLMMGIG